MEKILWPLHGSAGVLYEVVAWVTRLLVDRPVAGMITYGRVKLPIYSHSLESGKEESYMVLWYSEREQHMAHSVI